MSRSSVPQTLPVTVVIPAYRRPDMVERAVRSVFGQSRAPSEVIVVDDASGDDTGTRAARLGARVVTHERNMGEGGARNTGLREAANDWVALLDCDDEWLPDHLETMWGARDGHLIVGTAVLVTGDEPKDHRVQGWTGRNPRVLTGPAEVASPENKLVPSAVMVRRQAVLESGGFRDLRRAADLDMWLRVLESGTALAIPLVTALYHLHPGQISMIQQHRMDEAHRAVLESHAARPWCTRALLRRHEGVVAWDAARAAREGGSPAARTAVRLARRLTDPQRAIGVAQLLAWRLRSRRAAARLAPGGAPSVAIMPGVTVDPAEVPGAVDLRSLGLARALLHLLRHPASRAIVRGRAQALQVRALGVTPKQQ